MCKGDVWSLGLGAGDLGFILSSELIGPMTWGRRELSGAQYCPLEKKKLNYLTSSILLSFLLISFFSLHAPISSKFKEKIISPSI